MNYSKKTSTWRVVCLSHIQIIITLITAIDEKIEVLVGSPFVLQNLIEIESIFLLYATSKLLCSKSVIMIRREAWEILQKFDQLQNNRRTVIEYSFSESWKSEFNI